MARTSVTVDAVVYQRLSEIYNKRFGESPTAVVDALNQKFPEEREASKKDAPNSKRDLISDRTVRQFFKDTEYPKLSLVNLNYLCRLMLGSSYQDVLDNSDSLTDPSPTSVPKVGAVTLKEYVGISEIPPLDSWLPDYQEQIRQRHGYVRIPHMTKSRSLRSLYVPATLSKDLRTRKKKTINQLLEEVEGQTKANYMTSDAKDLLEEASKLMIWGRAGSGKTTLLKDLVCNSSFLPDIIPVFVSLTEYAKELIQYDRSLIESIESYIERLVEKSKHKISRNAIAQYLQEGQFFIALDGLDEVPKSYSRRVEDEINNLARSYSDNYYVLTCRFGSEQSVPESFMEVEVTDWSTEQIHDFVRKWFSSSKEKVSTHSFLKDLETNSVAADVAQNPLLLTLLCQLYEDGYEFPRDQTELLEDAVELYIRKWDSARRIKRDQDFEKKLSRQHRKDLFSEIAYASMVEDKPYWQRWELEERTELFIKNIPGVTDETREQDTMTVLHALEAEHGLLVRVSKEEYAFAHRSFQEFFAFLQVFADVGQSQSSIEALFDQFLLKRRFKTVLLMLINRQRDAEPILQLVRQRMDELVRDRPAIQDWLTWLNTVTQRAGVPTASWRACIATFDMETPMHFVADPHIDRILAQRLAENLRRFNQRHDRIAKPTPRIRLVCRLAVIYKLAIDRSVGQSFDFEVLDKFNSDYQDFQKHLKEIFAEMVDLCSEAELPILAEGLQALLKQFPEDSASQEAWKKWALHLQTELKEHLDEGYSFPVSPEDEAAVDNYIYLASLLVEAVLGDARCSNSFRETMLNSLFTPAPTAVKVTA